MKKLKTISFSIHIDSGRVKVWRVLWNPATYVKWTSVFFEGSHYKGELRQGNTIQFLGKEGNGLSTRIEKLIENEQMVFVHQKEIKNGVESETMWQGAKEIYNLQIVKDTGTELQVIMDITPDMEDCFNETFPKALELVKRISEQQ